MTETNFTKYAIIIGDYFSPSPSQDQRNELTSHNLEEALKYFLNFINKDVLINFATAELGITKIPKKTKKDEVITLVIATADYQKLKAFFTDNADSFALHPIQLEEILACSKTERRRWTDEERLPVLYYEDFKYGVYPVYDLVTTVALKNQVSQWRK
ncbi:MAG: hypothetical protein ACOCZG_01475, partial [Halothece sp.]